MNYPKSTGAAATDTNKILSSTPDVMVEFDHKDGLPTSLQCEFDQYVRAPQLKESRIYAIAGLLGSLLFLASDYQFLYDQFQHVATVRISLVAFLVVMLLLTRNVGMKTAFIMISLGLCAMNFIIVYIGVIASNMGYDTYQQGTIIILIYICTLLQAPLKHTIIMCVFCWVNYVLGVGLYSNTDMLVILNNSLVFAAGAVLGIMAVMQRERYMLGNFLQAVQLRRQKEYASQRALIDGLTELPNRYALRERLSVYGDVVPEGTLFLMLDVDDFKRVNDTLGHPLGDEILVAIAKKLDLISQEEQGFIARYGGEEFIMLVEGVATHRIEKVTQRLLSGVREIERDDFPRLTASIGGYVSKTKEASISGCIEKADQALLRAKEAGKNQAYFYE